MLCSPEVGLDLDKLTHWRRGDEYTDLPHMWYADLIG